LGRQSGEYSPPALCLALTAINSAISLWGTLEGGGRGDAGRNVLLQCAALISKLSDLLKEDAYFTRECFAEIVQVFGCSTGRESGAWWFVRSHR